MYGTGGYFEFTGFPDFKFHDDPNADDGAGRRPRRCARRAADAGRQRRRRRPRRSST